jgi:hypothetical protein
MEHACKHISPRYQGCQVVGIQWQVYQLAVTHAVNDPILQSDVDTIPENGTWFQLIQNGTVTVNTGPNGLQKLDTCIQMAEQHGLYVILSLTNNWFPFNATSTSTPQNNSLTRNYLSNNYGWSESHSC